MTVLRRFSVLSIPFLCAALSCSSESDDTGASGDGDSASLSGDGDGTCSGTSCANQGEDEEVVNNGMTSITVDPGTNDDEEEEPETCAEAQVEFEVRIPQVWMLLDRSGSMDWSLTSTDETGERWETLGRVLFGDNDDMDDIGVVGDFESQVSFGASFFTTEGDCNLDLVSVDLAMDNYQGIKDQFDMIGPTAGTPTAEAINSLAATVDATPASSGPKIIILATDGAPNNCTLTGEATQNVEDAVAAAFGDQILTFLVFIGPNLGEDHSEHLQAIANLGVGRAADAASPAEYYTAQDETKLREAFEAIVGGARGCTFDLEGEVEESGAQLGTVSLNGNELTYQDENGWRLASSNQVELVGSACEEIKDGETNLEINFPCEVYEVVAR